MSGGSYNYLCFVDSDNFFEYETERNLEKMADRLTELGYDDAAKETYSLLLKIRQSKNYTDSVIGRISGVWKAVEWMDSGDWGKDSVDEAIKKYRT